LAINGLRVSIIGQPNAGKSTFLNTILNEDRAIVSPDPGTTRDVLEAAIVHKGLNIIFSDTAGIRKAGGLIEAEGLRRAKEKVKFSDLTLILVDQAVLRKNPNIANELFDFVPRGKMLLVASKIDLYYESIEIKKSENKPSSLNSNQAEPPIGFHLSSKTNQGIDELLDRIYELCLGGDPVDFKEGVLTTERQVELLKKATTHLEAGLNLFKKDEYMEIVSIEIRAFISTIADITGEVSNEEIYEKLFSNFCIGK
jgi:tRNA modification GTPase